MVQHGLDGRTFVYLDPPYARDEERVFREYDQKSFVTQDWLRLPDERFETAVLAANGLLTEEIGQPLRYDAAATVRHCGSRGRISECSRRSCSASYRDFDRS